MTKMMRYNWIYHIIDHAQPQTIVEIGVHNGARALAMSQRALQHHKEVTYWGYDLWEFMQDHEAALNGKGPSKRVKADTNLANLKKQHPGYRYNLIQGDHEHTVPNALEVDLVFIDGDHRREAIARDYSRVRGSKVVVFDDHYTPEIPGMGANDIQRHRPTSWQILMPSEDRERFTGHINQLLVIADDPDLCDYLIGLGGRLR